MKIYLVYETYDEDGGFGDAVTCERVVNAFLHKADADAFKEKYDNPHVYDKPYTSLYCGGLDVREIEVYESFNASEKNYWSNIKGRPCDFNIDGKCPYNSNDLDDCEKYCG